MTNVTNEPASDEELAALAKVARETCEDENDKTLFSSLVLRALARFRPWQERDAAQNGIGYDAESDSFRIMTKLPEGWSFRDGQAGPFPTLAETFRDGIRLGLWREGDRPEIWFL